jgi:regulator of protease activity HflC (stomatin/prohibitin superfamily)
MNDEISMTKVVGIGIAGLVALGVVWFVFSFAYQYYKVFSATQSGKAEYAQADQNRQITIIEAQAANEAATSKALATIKIAQAEAQAEVERAKGVAQANAIIGDSLKGNEDYLRYLYITGMTHGDKQIIYIPTEAGLPILEASHR